jgi:hypothetical protein
MAREKNPFYPDVERVPLRLILDARSLGALAGEAREDALFLCELCWTKAIEAIWSWEGDPIEAHIARTELRPVANNARAVGRTDEPPACFIGGVFAWDQFDRWADQQGFEDREREWFTYYGPLAHFSNRGWHYLVTADERLLRESEGDAGWFRQGRHRIISVDRALSLAGLVMKAHREVFYESPQPGHTVYAHSHQMYEWLAYELIGLPGWLFDSLKKPGETREEFYRTEPEALGESIYDRIGDILQSRDRIALANARQQDDGTLGELRYDLTSMISSVSAVLDAMAVLAHLAFSIELAPGAGDAAISLRRREFRKALRMAGGENLADIASGHSSFLHFVWGLRNPMLHRHGLPGYNLHVLGAGTEPQITLSDRQVELLERMCGQRGEKTEQWGLREKVAGIDASVKPMVFGHRLALATIDVLCSLTTALAEDKGVERESSFWTPERKTMVRRFRRLSGIPDDI